MSHYTTISSGGDLCTDNRDAYIMLYPNTSNEDSYAQSGSIVVNTLEDMLGRLLTVGAINYWEIQRFKVDTYGNPDMTKNQVKNASCYFNDYLLGPDSPYSGCDMGTNLQNGTGDDLTGVIGVHFLIHNMGSCTVEYVGGGGGEDCGTGSAFTTGRQAWMKVSCSDNDLVRNSAMQEPLHQFILQSFSCVQDDIGNGSCEDEHALGKIDDNGGIDGYGMATPMITFHEEESGVANCGSCSTGNVWNKDWSQYMTSCTEDAVGCTARNQCESHPDC